MADASLDLDARRKARVGTPKTLKFEGETYELVPSLPIMVGEHLVKGDMLAAFGLLFGDEVAADLAPRMDVDDLTDICTELYGVTLGESPASSASSKKSGGRSRPTSKASTA